MKKTLAVGLLLLGAVAVFAQGPHGGGFGGWGGRGPGMMGAGPGSRTPVTGAPYSATETVTSQQLLVGNQIAHSQQSTVARDGQGRISTTQTIAATTAGAAAYTVQTIFDPVAGYQYVLNSSTMTAMQMPLPKARTGGTRPAQATRPARPNTVTSSLGTQTINGQLSTGNQVTETIPAGAIGNVQPILVTRVTWISVALQVPVQIKTSDPRFGSTDMELTNIVPAEPNATLFVVPAGYTVKQGGRGFGGPGGGPRGPKGGGHEAGAKPANGAPGWNSQQ